MRIAIGMPMVGDVAAEILGPRMKLAMEIIKRPDVEDVKLVTCLNVFPFDHAREHLVKVALKNKCDYMFFLDADTICPFDAFDLLYGALVSESAQAVSAHYRRRGHPYTCVWAKISDRAKTIMQCDAPKGSGVHVINSSGLGCNLIDLNWCEAHLAHPWFKIGSNPDGSYTWEDAYFHSQLQLAEGKLIGHADVRCVHLAERMGVCDANWEQLLRNSTQLQVNELNSRESQESECVA